MEQIRSQEITAGSRSFHLTVEKEDLSAVYPHLFRYSLTVHSEGKPVALFRTNSYEYAPGVPLQAEDVVLKKADRWAQELSDDPDGFLEEFNPGPEKKPELPAQKDVVIIQASPRADGNSEILALWSKEIATGRGLSCTVLYPHDMDLHECIGCYQCFNTGSCIYDDDMAGIIDLVKSARLTVICTPVYSNTVPGSLKVLIDRFQSHAGARSLGMVTPGPGKGIACSVSGRAGLANFTCIKKVLTAFFHTAGIAPSGELFIDDVDRVRDIHEVVGARERLTELLEHCFR